MTDLLLKPEDFAEARGVAYDPSDLAAELALRGACDAVRTQCNRSFGLVLDEVSYLSGDGTDDLLLPDVPVVTVSEVALLDWSSVTDPYPLESTDWDLDADVGTLISLRTVSCGWPRGRRNVKVTWSHGWLLPTQTMAEEEDLPDGVLPADLVELPFDIQLVVTQLASRRYTVLAAGGQTVSQSSRTIMSYSETNTYDSGGAAESDAESGFTGIELSVLDKYTLEH